MNIIIFNSKSGESRTLRLRPVLVLPLLMVSLALAAWLGITVADALRKPTAYSEAWVNQVNAELEEYAKDIAATKRHAANQLSAITVRTAELQARLMRLDALGERLVRVADLQGGEFDFSQVPALGGPAELDEMGADINDPQFLSDLDQLTQDIEVREEQLEVMESVLANRKLRKEVSLAGRPVTWGWLSSRYGPRTDPFTGKSSWHAGIDFAGKLGADIVSVGSGVVTWAGKRFGYGLMVEVNHGDGYSTRYAHAQELVVKVGDIVKHGQTIAKIGTSGRSTGPHVHFEVRKDGKTMDPSKFVTRARQ